MGDVSSVSGRNVILQDLSSADQLIESFLAAHDVREVSREGYRRRLRQFFRYCSANGIQNPSRQSILDYKRFLVKSGFTPASEGAYLTAVKCWFTWAESVKLYPNVAKNVKGTKKQRGFRRDPLTIPQVHRLLASIDRSTLKGARDYALLNLMIRVAPRSIEITRANIEDVKQESGQAVLWLQGKGADSKDQFVVLTESVLQPLMAYLAMRSGAKGSDPLFGSTSDGNRHGRMTTKSIRRIVKERLRGVNLESPRLSAHSLRHTAITLSLIAGASIQETQQMARHANINTTLIYAHNIERAAGIPEKKIDELLATKSST